MGFYGEDGTEHLHKLIHLAALKTKHIYDPEKRNEDTLFWAHVHCRRHYKQLIKANMVFQNILQSLKIKYIFFE